MYVYIVIYYLLDCCCYHLITYSIVLCFQTLGARYVVTLVANQKLNDELPSERIINKCCQLLERIILSDQL
jgi:hypothetical protein